MRRRKSGSGSSLSGGCMSLFGLPFLAGGIATSFFYFAGYSEWWRSQGWEEVPCWIESVELESHSGDDSTTYQARATYRYEYGGKEYHGKRVSFGLGADNVGDFQQEAHRELAGHVLKNAGPPENAEAVGDEGDRKPFHCYVNPAKPEEAVLYRVLRWQMQAFMAIFALTFPAVGAALVAGGFVAARAMRRDARLRENHPDEPWKWKSIWGSGTIAESSRSGSKALYLYTFWSGLVIFPLIVTTAMTGAFRTDATAWLVLIFVMLWCIPAWFTFRRIRQRLAIGSPRFELTDAPACPGGVLAGAVLLERPLPMRGNAELLLTCVKQITRSTGDGTSTTVEKVWSHRENVTFNGITRDISGFRLPVAISLPADSPQSDEGDDPSVKYRWKLQLKVPGTAIRPEFEIPVFRTGKSPAVIASPVVGMSTIQDSVAEDLPALLAARRIRADFDSNGFPMFIDCPAARHRSMIVFLFIFNLIWTAVAVFLFYKDAPLIFRIVWPVSAAAIWWAIVYQILHSRSVTFSPLGLELTNRLGPMVRSSNFEKSQIIGFNHDTNMSSNNTTYYRVRLTDTVGKQQTLVDGITESTTAATLAQRMEAWRKSGH